MRFAIFVISTSAYIAMAQSAPSNPVTPTPSTPAPIASSAPVSEPEPRKSSEWCQNYIDQNLISGNQVRMKLPPSLMKYVDGNVLTGSMTYEADLKLTDNGISVNGQENWAGTGFPDLSSLMIKKVKAPKSGAASIELKKNKAYFTLKFQSKEELAMIADKIFFLTDNKEAMDLYEKEAYSAVSGHIFSGLLSAQPSDCKTGLLKDGLQQKAANVGTNEFKDKQYFILNLGLDTSVYNDLKLSQSQRIALVIGQQILDNLKPFGKYFSLCKEPLIGLKITYQIPHKSFAEEYAVPQYDQLAMYVSFENIKKFSEFEITSQDMINASIIIVNGNRISVTLNQ